MMNTVMLHRAALLSAAGSLLLAGCAAPKPMYQWEGYQTQVYEYFKGESREAQITALESGLQKIRAQSGSVPPGYHAQLGLLYLNTGKGDQMIKEFQTEKTLFPESAPYMDFLLRNVKSDTRTEIKTGAAAGKDSGTATATATATTARSAQ